MLKPIHLVPCSPALDACQRLQQHLVEWLCDAEVTAQNITQENMRPPRVPTKIEANWLWSFLQRVDARRTLLDRAEVLAGMSNAEKVELLTWNRSVAALAIQFQPNPPNWPVARPTISEHAWKT